MKIKWVAASPRQLLIPANFTLFGQAIPSRIIMHIGFWRREMEVVVDSSLPENTIGMSSQLFEKVTMPDQLDYELKIKGRNFFIGPVIGILPVKRKKYLNSLFLEGFKDYMVSYPKLNGLIIIFAEDGIDFENRCIEGYFYNMKENCWQPGSFPFPGAIYRKTELSKTVYDKLVEIMGDNIFNAYFFNKWEFWDQLSQYKEVKQYLPETEKLSSAENLQIMLQKHQEVYIKLVDGERAKGIVQVRQSPEGYRFTRSSQEEVIQNQQEVQLYLQKLKQKGNYLLQQAIDMRDFDGRRFDFRVILQKNKTGEWDCTGIIGRFGQKGSFTTNFTVNGFALSGIESLKKACFLTEKQAFLKEQEIIRACKQIACRLDDAFGHYGDLGIDVVVDRQLKIWILEANKLHDHKMPLYGLNNKQMYYKVRLNPLLYAKTIAGF